MIEIHSNLQLAGKRVWVAGHGGMVGGAVVRRLGSEGCDILTVGRKEVDLRRQAAVDFEPSGLTWTLNIPDRHILSQG